MFAVVRTGGKQYKVAKGDLIRVEKIEAKDGDNVTLDDVLLVGKDGAVSKLGTPTVSGASVTAEVVAQTRAPKVIVFKKKRRQNYRRKQGHRQNLTLLRIQDIKAA